MTEGPNARAISWSMLLAKWTRLAQEAVALPDVGEPGRVKRALPAIIGVNAVACALREIDELPDGERRAGIDKGEVLLKSYAAQIHEVWKGEAVHPSVQEMLDDARRELARAKDAGVEWVVASVPLIAEHPAELVAALLAGGFAGDLYLPNPGVPLFVSCPCGFLRSKGGESGEAMTLIDAFLGKGATTRRDRSRFRQAYRQFDFAKGGPVRDLVVVHDDELVPGQPLLVPAVLGGEAMGVSLAIPAARQQALLPVEFA
jgi:hypothetical protein